MHAVSKLILHSSTFFHFLLNYQLPVILKSNLIAITFVFCTMWIITNSKIHYVHFSMTISKGSISKQVLVYKNFPKQDFNTKTHTYLSTIHHTLFITHYLLHTICHTLFMTHMLAQFLSHFFISTLLITLFLTNYWPHTI